MATPIEVTGRDDVTEEVVNEEMEADAVPKQGVVSLHDSSSLGDKGKEEPSKYESPSEREKASQHSSGLEAAEAIAEYPAPLVSNDQSDVYVEGSPRAGPAGSTISEELYPALSISEKDWGDDEWYIPERDGRKRVKGRASDGGIPFAPQSWELNEAVDVRPRVRAVSEFGIDSEEEEGDDDEEEEEGQWEELDDHEESEVESLVEEEEEEEVRGNGLSVRKDGVVRVAGREGDRFGLHEYEDDDNSDVGVDEENDGVEESSISNVSQSIIARMEAEEELEPFHTSGLNAKVVHDDEDEWEEEDEEDEEDLDEFLDEALHFVAEQAIPRAAPSPDHEGVEHRELPAWISLRRADLSEEQQKQVEEARSALMASEALASHLETELDGYRKRASTLEAMTLRLSEELHAKRRLVIISAERARLAEAAAAAMASKVETTGTSENAELAQLKEEVQRLREEMAKKTVQSARGDEQHGTQVEEVTCSRGGAIETSLNGSGEEARELIAKLRRDLECQEKVAKDQANKATMTRHKLLQAEQALEAMRSTLQAEEVAKREMTRDLKTLREQVASLQQSGKGAPNERLGGGGLRKVHGRDKMLQRDIMAKDLGLSDVDEETKKLKEELKSVMSLLSEAAKCFCLEKCLESGTNGLPASQNSGGELVKLLTSKLQDLQEEVKAAQKRASGAENRLATFGIQPDEAAHLESIEKESDRLKRQAKAVGEKLELERQRYEDKGGALASFHSNPLFVSEPHESERAGMSGSPNEREHGLVKSLVRKFEDDVNLTRLEIEQWKAREEAAKTEAQRHAVRHSFDKRLQSVRATAVGGSNGSVGEGAKKGRGQKSVFAEEVQRDVAFPSLKNVHEAETKGVGGEDHTVGQATEMAELQVLGPQRAAGKEGGIEGVAEQGMALGVGVSPDRVQAGASDVQSPDLDSERTKCSLEERFNESQVVITEDKAQPERAFVNGGSMGDRQLWKKLAALQQDLANAKARASQLCSGLKRAQDQAHSVTEDDAKMPDLPKGRPIVTKQWSAAALTNGERQTDRQSRFRETLRTRTFSSTRGV